MKLSKVTIAVLVIATLVFYKLYLNEDPVEFSKDSVLESSLGNTNKPVFIAGCKTFEGPEEPVVVYPTVKHNFLALTCALEVPPSFEIMVMQRFGLNFQSEEIRK